MLSNLPVAFVGYGWDREEGFFIKVCPFCPEKQRAEQEAKPLPVKVVYCSRHYQQQLAARMGERIE